MDILAAVTFAQGVVAFFFVLTCVLLMIVVLLQKGRGGGLSGAFGGVGGHSAFGAKTGDVFTWVTVALTGLFVLIAVIGNYVMVPGPPTGAAVTTAAPTPGGGDAAEDAAPGGGQSSGGPTSPDSGG